MQLQLRDIAMWSRISTPVRNRETTREIERERERAREREGHMHRGGTAIGSCLESRNELQCTTRLGWLRFGQPSHSGVESCDLGTVYVLNKIKPLSWLSMPNMGAAQQVDQE